MFRFIVVTIQLQLYRVSFEDQTKWSGWWKISRIMFKHIGISRFYEWKSWKRIVESIKREEVKKKIRTQWLNALNYIDNISLENYTVDQNYHAKLFGVKILFFLILRLKFTGIYFLRAWGCWKKPSSLFTC